MGDALYSRQPLTQDTNAPFSLFGLNREKAYLLLRRNIDSVRETMKFLLLQDVLVVNKDFVHSLSEDYSALKAVAQQYFEAKQRQVPNLARYSCLLQLYANDLSLLDAYIEYDVKNGQVDEGWCHPLILSALADLLDIHLSFYEIDDHGKMIPHKNFPGYIVEPPKERIELLMTHGYHFERVMPYVTAKLTFQSRLCLNEDINRDSSMSSNMTIFG